MLGPFSFIKNVPSKGYVTLTETKADAVSALNVTEDGIETPFYVIKLDEAGQFTSIYDKEAKRELLQKGTVGNELRIYEDKPMNFSCWDIDIYYCYSISCYFIVN